MYGLEECDLIQLPMLLEVSPTTKLEIVYPITLPVHLSCSAKLYYFGNPHSPGLGLTGILCPRILSLMQRDLKPPLGVFELESFTLILKPGNQSAKWSGRFSSLILYFDIPRLSHTSDIYGLPVLCTRMKISFLLPFLD